MEKIKVELTKNELELLIEAIRYIADQDTLEEEEIKLYEKLKKYFTN